ncbi:hypothetical protein CPC698_1675 [Chlamydia psittaci C6/98]|nr:hypothetical protein CP08DC60_1179 [Chlamydia psittaci 08DC60]EPP32765.1 hypothetical protein CPC698_1675 [Chlamydia psittaci C6/98]
MRCINRKHASFSRSCFLLFNGRYFLFHHSPLWVTKYEFANCTRRVLVNGSLRGKLKLCEMN